MVPSGCTLAKRQQLPTSLWGAGPSCGARISTRQALVLACGASTPDRSTGIESVLLDCGAVTCSSCLLTACSQTVRLSHPVGPRTLGPHIECRVCHLDSRTTVHDLHMSLSAA